MTIQRKKPLARGKGLKAGKPTRQRSRNIKQMEATQMARNSWMQGEKQPGYGKAQTVTIGGVPTRVKSEAEARFAREIDAAVQGGLVVEWQYEPQAFPIDYKYRHADCTDTYTPDFRVVWKDEEGEVFYEVKSGLLTPKYASKLKRFVQQYPDKKVVLVWRGRLPSRGKTADRIAKIRPYLFYVREIS